MEIENGGYGYNLNLQVLDGILSHNGEMLDDAYRPDRNKNWEQFLWEYEQCFLEEKFDQTIRPMTLEGCVMRVADIIAYVGRDIEDAVKLHIIKREDLPTDITQVLGDTNSAIINTLINDLLVNSAGKDYLAFSPPIHKALDELKTFNYRHIYLNPLIKTENSKIARMYRLLFNAYFDDLEDNGEKSYLYLNYLQKLSPAYRKTTPQKRVVVDFIAGMTDEFFNNQFLNLYVPSRFGYTIDELPYPVTPTLHPAEYRPPNIEGAQLFLTLK
jgi:dGTPase